MSAVGVGSKYHCAINGVGYMLGARGYMKKDAPVFTPRFGTGEQGLNDLELFKSWAMDDFSGGSFQEEFDQVNQSMIIKNMIINKYDNLLYTTPAITATTSIPSLWRSSANLWAVYKGVLYMAANGAGSGAGGKGALYKYVPSTKSWTSVKTDFADKITGITTVAGYLWIATNSAVGGFWSYDGTTWTSMTGAGYINICSFNGLIYGDGLSGVGTLHRHSAVPGTNSVTQIGDVGDKYYTLNSLKVFNSRLYIGKPDGLYAYDGTSITPVLDYNTDIDPKNFKYMDVMQGALYFTVRNKLYKFSGANIELVREFAYYETIVDLRAEYGRLWVTTNVTTTVTSKDMTSGDSNVYAFDGTGWFLYNNTTTQSNYLAYGVAYINDGTYQHLLIGLAASTAADNKVYAIDFATEFQGASSSVGKMITSIFDAGFPNIDKYFDAITTNFDKMTSGDQIDVKYKVMTNLGDASTQTASSVAGTAADDSSTGTLAWQNPGNTASQDSTFAAPTLPLDTGFKTPTVSPSAIESGTGFNDWTNPSNGYTEDGSYATVDVTTAPYQNASYDLNQSYGTFGFSIPTNATITGLTIIAKGKVSAGSNYIQLLPRSASGFASGDPAKHYGSQSAINLSTTNTQYTKGGANDLWGTIWSPSDFSDANFSLIVQAGSTGNDIVQLDGLQVKVHYTVPIADNLIKLVKGGTIGGNSKADTITNWPSTASSATYGSASDLWGNTLTPSDINASTFGIAISANFGTVATHYLKLTNFGFAIPTTATIVGIQATINRSTSGIDYVSLMVSYTLPGDTWITLGTITNSSTSRVLKLYETTNSGTFKKIQIQIQVTRGSSSTLALRNFYMNYYIAPVQAWLWQLKLLTYGNSDTPLQLADNSTTETRTPAFLRDNVYQARIAEPPVGFEDIDFTKVSNGGTLNNSATTIPVLDTSAFRSYGYIKIDDEIIKYTGKTTSSFTGCTRGALATTAASHTDATVVNAYYRVVIKSIDSESVIVPNQDVKGQESDLAVTLQEAPFNA